MNDCAIDESPSQVNDLSGNDQPLGVLFERARCVATGSQPSTNEDKHVRTTFLMDPSKDEYIGTLWRKTRCISLYGALWSLCDGLKENLWSSYATTASGVWEREEP